MPPLATQAAGRRPAQQAPQDGQRQACRGAIPGAEALLQHVAEHWAASCQFRQGDAGEAEAGLALYELQGSNLHDACFPLLRRRAQGRCGGCHLRSNPPSRVGKLEVPAEGLRVQARDVQVSPIEVVHEVTPVTEAHIRLRCIPCLAAHRSV